MATSTAAKPALLVMDYQNFIMEKSVGGKQEEYIERVNKLIKHAEENNVLVVFVAVQFREGHPEISSRNKLFSGVKGGGALVEGTEGAALHAKLYQPKSSVVVIKRRVSAIGTTDLHAILRGNDITDLYLAGFSTSGVVLSTLTCAADLDYSLTVIEDACGDANPETHKFLCENVFVKHARIMKAEEVSFA